MRSLLVVPPDPRTFGAFLQAGADAILLDLTGGPTDAAAARATAAACLAGRSGEPPCPVFVGLHPLDAGCEADLDAVVGARPDGVLLSDCAGPADVLRLSAMLAACEALAGLPDGSIRIVAGAADTPAGALALAGYRDAGRRLVALSFGRRALAAALGLPPHGDAAPLETARALLAIAATAARIPAIDAPFDHSADAAGLARDAEAARRMGYRGKLAIDPRQVALINRAFGDA